MEDLSIYQVQPPAGKPAGGTHFAEEESEARQEGRPAKVHSVKELASPGFEPRAHCVPSLARAQTPPIAVETAGRVLFHSLPPCFSFFCGGIPQRLNVSRSTQLRSLSSPDPDPSAAGALLPDSTLETASRAPRRAPPPPSLTPTPSPAHLPPASPWQRPHGGGKKSLGLLQAPSRADRGGGAPC